MSRGERIGHPRRESPKRRRLNSSKKAKVSLPRRNLSRLINASSIALLRKSCDRSLGSLSLSSAATRRETIREIEEIDSRTIEIKEKINDKKLLRRQKFQDKVPLSQINRKWRLMRKSSKMQVSLQARMRMKLQNPLRQKKNQSQKHLHLPLEYNKNAIERQNRKRRRNYRNSREQTSKRQQISWQSIADL